MSPLLRLDDTAIHPAKEGIRRSEESRLRIAVQESETEAIRQGMVSPAR